MTVNYEKTTSTEGIITFEVPVEDVKEASIKAYNKIKGSISVPGFRKGHVPRQIFNNVYGEESLYEEIMNELVPTAYEKAVQELDLDVVAQPQIQVESMEKGKPWVVKATVFTKPEVKLGQYKDLTVAKQETEATEEDINQRIDAMREEFAELSLKDGPAENGDTVVIDFAGYVNDEAFEGGTGENYSLELGSNSFIPGFEDQLVGAHAGEDVTVNVVFPEEYHSEDLAGKDARFEVKVHEVKGLSLPELDDEFAQDADDEVETFEELRNKIAEELTETKKNQAQELMDEEALTKAVENAEIIDLPQVMIEEEIQRQMQFFFNNLQAQGINEEMYYQSTQSSAADLRQQYAEDAEVRTKTNLVLEAIVKAENYEATEEEIQEELANLAEQYGMELEQVRNYVTEEMLAVDVNMKKAMDLVTKSAIAE